ncbi:hypothetical protein COHA_000292 [Chlorella ohadii]|uniref:Methyltransferase type 12 domain-containing protein n=1 Tax=Chlorella ohadii TaxID=2649997 RepID=A0AAD5DZ06_9CHLO|nr:hypothetical protein COHA_000292 [Chlorella ohadii]
MDLCKASAVPRDRAVKYEQEGARYWDLFYKRNTTNFFKDRHWLAREFPALLDAAAVLEVGCGVGNTTFPLLEVNPSAQVYACDYAPTAIRLVKENPAYAASGRVHAFVADITADDLTAQVPAGSVDACTMIFVLSAIAPALQRHAIRRVAAALRPGGRLLFRDYAAGDLCQERLSGEGKQQQLGDNFFVRWDGTCAYYFTEASPCCGRAVADRVRSIFEAEGFDCEYVGAANKLMENRKKGEQLDRRFVQAVFTYTGQPSAAAEDEEVAAGPGQAAVALLRRNAQHNSHLFIIERLRLQQLAWRGPAVQQQDQQQQQQQRQQQQGSMQQQERQLRQAFPDGFQAVLACVPPVDEELHGLLAAASVQLSRQPGALLLLCGGSDAAGDGTCAQDWEGAQCSLCKTDYACVNGADGGTGDLQATCSRNLTFAPNSILKAYSCELPSGNFLSELIKPGTMLVRCATGLQPGQQLTAASPAPEAAGGEAAAAPAPDSSLTPEGAVQDIIGAISGGGGGGSGRRLHTAGSSYRQLLQAPPERYCNISFTVANPTVVDVACKATDCTINPGSAKLFKVILSLDGVPFQMTDRQLRTTLGVLYNISGQRFQFATQQASTQYSVPLLPVPQPPPAASGEAAAPAPSPAARRLLGAVRNHGRRLAQQESGAAAAGGECSSSAHSVVGSPAACMVRCNGLLTPLQGDTYTGPTGLLCCRCIAGSSPSPRPPRPPPPAATEPDYDSLQRPYPANAWYLPPPAPNATAPPGATGTYVFADAPVLMAQVAALKASLYGASANGYLKERLNAQGIATTNATIWYADIGTPYFVPPVIPAGNATAAAAGSSNAGKIAGIAVGVAAALAAAAAAAWLFVRWRRRRQQEAAQAAAAAEVSKAESQRRFEEWRAQGGTGSPAPSPPVEHADEISDASAASDASGDAADAAGAAGADLPASAGGAGNAGNAAGNGAVLGVAQERTLRTRLSDKPNMRRVGGGYVRPQNP